MTPPAGSPPPSRAPGGPVLAAAVLGVLLAGITPNPPVSWLGWVQLAGASVLTGLATALAARGQTGVRARRDPWLATSLGRHWRAVAVGVLVTAVVAIGAPPFFGLMRGVWYQAFGCPPATQLRMVAEPETIVTADEVAAAYERSTAEASHGCVSVRVHVFEASAATIRDTLGSGNGWSGPAALRDVGPRPDVWLASTAHDVDALPDSLEPDPVADRVPIARSPLVLAVPDPAAQPGVGWPELVGDLTGRRRPVVRPDPLSGELGLLATALLYGPPGPPDAPRANAEVERRIEPARDTADLLCGLRSATAPADPPAIITTEQNVARYNNGMALGGSCDALSATARAPRLVALYPTGTADQDLQFVELGGNDPVQRTAATAFRRWLQSDDGGAALVGTGLRPLDPSAWSAPLTKQYGVDPTGSPPSQPLQADRWTAAATAYATAQRPSRLLFLLDTSGSMATPERDPVTGAVRTRGQITAEAVRTGLTRLGARDEFGLWFFPGDAGSGYTEAVPVGPRTDASVADAGRELTDVPSVGRSPLFQTMIDGVTALPDDERFGVRALVVLTDGPDNTRSTTASATARDVAGRGVQVVVVTLADIRCSGGGLPAIVGATNGDCEDADPTTVATVTAEKVAELRGGR